MANVTTTAFPPVHGPTSLAFPRHLLRGQIPALNGLRGIAAFLVFVAHVQLLPDQFGALGVGLFFVLSGFLITWLLIKEADDTGRVSLKAFYLRRTLRIFPAFYVYWLVCIGSAYWMKIPFHWLDPASAFLYMSDYFSAVRLSLFPDIQRIMGITWSLGIEEKFYLFWPWTFRKLFRNRQAILRFIVGAIGVVWLYRIVVGPYTPSHYMRYAFEARFDNLMYGCLLAFLVRGGRHDRLLCGLAASPLFPVLTVLALGANAYIEEYLGFQYLYRFGMSLDAALCAILIVQLIPLSQTRLWSWLEWPVSNYCGQISYSFYLYHATAILVVKTFVHSRAAVQIPLAFALAVTLASVSYLVVEKPFLRLKDRLSKHSPQAPRVLAKRAGAAG